PTRSEMAPYASTVPFEAFGHSAFSRRYAAQAIALSQWKSPDPKPSLPNAPYTPVLKSLTLDYSPTSTLDLVQGDLQSAAAFLIVGPFGATRAGVRAAPRVVPEIEG